ncbi:phospholipase A1-Igamma2, chloroplastic-like [Nicotiana tomentosiformis]|uniref:phospholipase A1-Igamma2, chloroplastic-like n=1 Tax=Nicotiana tomentosiformis TaxID=4098 RepID=UPI000878AD30
MIISNSRIISLFTNLQKPNIMKNPSQATMFFFSEPGKKVTTRNYSLKVLSKNDSSFPILSDIKKKKNKVYDDEEAKIAEKWKDIHGQNDWEGMLDPINPLLRAELIRYGEMAQACYDAFHLDQDSKFCGSCKIDPGLFFQSLGLSANHGYNVTSYIYSMYHINIPSFFKVPLWPDAWSHKANWIGYVAVSNDEYSTHLGRRDITIAWRGTVTDLEKIADFMDFQKPTRYHKIPSRDPTIKVEAGFLEIYTSKDDECNFCKVSAREQVLAEVKRLIDRYSNEEISITITGHSLGSALATINAYDIAEIGLDVREDGRVIPICVFSFSGPRVGNIRFKQRLEGLGVKVLRVVNKHDKVPAVPGIFLNENVPTFVQKVGELFLPWCYLHVGEELVLDHKTSPFLKDIDNLTYFHNLEVHLHLLDGLV